MSKSKGPLLTLKSAVKEYGADITRLYILSTAEHVQDADWRAVDVDATRKQVERFYKMAHDIQNKDDEEGLKFIDRWMLSRLQYRIRETRNALDKIQTRRAVHNAFYLLMNDMRWYERRGGSAARRQVLLTWIRLMAPFTPHICDEIAEALDGNLVSLALYPEADPLLVDRGAELAEEITRNTLGDIEEILRLIKIKPKRIILYTSASWKKEVLKKAIMMKKGNVLDMKTLLNSLLIDPRMRSYVKEIPKYAQKVITDIQGMDNEFMNSLIEVDFDEATALNEAMEFLSHAVECDIEIYSADSPSYDPQGKSRTAAPMRPAIYIE